jgi:DNA-binding ferritin-like protein
MDKRLIRLNAFGEEILGKGQNRALVSDDPDDSYFITKERIKSFLSDEEGEEMETPKYKYETVFKNILQNISQAKLLHWQTCKYAQHKALDELFESLIELGDELAESVMGKYGRPHLSEENLCLRLFNYNNNLSFFMDELYNCYRNDCRCLFDDNKDSELVNIIDEIIAVIDKIKYLLTLE